MPEEGRLSIYALPANWATWEAEKTEGAVSGGRLWLAHVELVNGGAAQRGE